MHTHQMRAVAESLTAAHADGAPSRPLRPLTQRRCADTAAQPAPPAPRRSPSRRPSIAKSPSGTSSRADSRRLIPSKSGLASPATSPSVDVSPKARSSARAICCFRSIRDRSRPKSIACAPSSRARARPCSARRPSCSAPSGLRSRERDVAGRTRSAGGVRAGIHRAGGRRRSRAAGGGAESRVHARDLAHQRAREPRVCDRRQPRVERPGRSHAADDRRLARSHSRALRRRRARLPADTRRRRRSARTVATQSADSHGARHRARDSRERGRWTSSTTG